jgi:prepilin-type N-terminal cleavage/methylation domain-containing protein
MLQVIKLAMKNKAFTLIELLVVVAIIGILAAVGITTFSNFTVSAKINTTKKIYYIAEKKIKIAATACMSGIGHTWDDGRKCISSTASGDTIAAGVSRDMNNIYPKNVYDSKARATEWNQTYGFAYCPISRSAVIPKGQVVLGYGENGSKNYCRMGGGNMACIRANIGDKDGNDFYLEAEFNMCDFK